MDKADKVFKKFDTVQSKACTMNGLLMAQVIAQRHLMEAFDGKPAQEVVLAIMGEIAEAMADADRRSKPRSKE
jgi:hypothetical protein